jgi:LuxR family maltose regulon positive regulatory protein
VAARLEISVHTVGTHVKNTYRKLGVHRAAAAVRRAGELGLLPRRAKRRGT